MFNAANWFWQLPDGRVWSTSAAAWVTAETAQAWATAQGWAEIPASPVDETGEHTESGLYDALVFYGLPVGVLAPAPTLEEARAAKLAEINTKYSTVMAYIQAGYPLEEILSWEKQSTQAQALQQNPEAAAAFVRGLAATKGVDVEEMAQRILANAASWEPIAALLTGQRQAMEECAHAAQTVVAINEIKVNYPV